MRTEAAHGELGLVSGRDGKLGSGRHAVGECLHERERLRPVEDVEVVEHQHHGLFAVREVPQHPGQRTPGRVRSLR
jgi:hypothetical protein